MPNHLKIRCLLAGLALLALLLPGCGGQISFEKIDYKGHVRIDSGGAGYCFKVPTDWEIRETLEGADVVCLAPLESGFRDSVVARSLAASKLPDPEEFMSKQLAELGDKVEILEPWSEPGKPVVVKLTESKFSREPLGQMLFLHMRPDGAAVLMTCTTTASQLETKRSFFEELIAKAKYELEDCPGIGGLPSSFPTPQVTLSPGPG